MKPFTEMTIKINQTIIREDDNQNHQPNDSVDPLLYKGGTLFPGSDDDD